MPFLKEKPTDNNLLLIRETLLPIHMEIPYDQLGGIHSLTAILTNAVRYTTNHGGNTFVHPTHLPHYDGIIADDATTVICIRAEFAHKAHFDDCTSYAVAKNVAAMFLCNAMEEVWYNKLKDANTLLHKGDGHGHHHLP
jgi:hypothetical protein